MDTTLLQAMTDIVFKGNLLYLSPFLLLLMVILFTDRLVEFISNSINDSGSRRRSRY